MTTTTVEDELEWEEWDGIVPFWHHCIAGSTAGVMEHTLLYPMDTVKTHLQCSACPHRGSVAARTSNSTGLYSKSSFPATPAKSLSSTMRQIMSSTATYNNDSTTSTRRLFRATRLWRGVQSMVVGCIPAHALYFSSYEIIKQKYGSTHHWGMAAAGAAATMSHDVIMTPLDTVKQRLQLGHYQNMTHALREIYKTEGLATGLYKSFPVTLLTNIPYGAIMVSTNEACKQMLTKEHETLSLSTCMISSSIAGMVAAATTTPLDRIKTVLQTQQLQPACDLGACPKLSSSLSFRKAVVMIFKQEGLAGFWRGWVPRVVTHTPAVAISWTTYETAKQWLARM